MSEEPLHVAIVGGGLCGLSLAIALTKCGISFTLYEARASFTEIGAGINVSRNAHQAFHIIDPAIADALLALTTRNEPGREDVWMDLSLGAPTGRFEDGYMLHSLMAPPTGNTTASRNEVLQLLARSISLDNARFNKKLADIQQDDDGVTLSFDDGTQDRASLVIGCDGAHSTIRRIILGLDNPATAPRFSETGGYRAVFPMHVQEALVGEKKARNSNIWIGPGGYVVMYPIDGGKNVNIGLWPWKKGDWEHEAWVLPNQKKEMLEDFAAWGPTIQKTMETMGEDTAFWATFHHSVKPERYFRGRACMIGDASHAMCPHQGQGAAQSMEDACVMAEVLQHIDKSSNTPFTMSDQIEAAFLGYETVRKPRFERALDSSINAFSLWAGFWHPELLEADIKRFQQKADESFAWLWNSDIEGQGRKAKAEMSKILDERQQSQKSDQANLAKSVFR